MYSISFTENNKNYCLSLHYNGTISYIFINGTEVFKLLLRIFKFKDSQIVVTSLWLGNISKDFSVDNMKNKGSNGHVQNFMVDYDAISVDDIFDIRRYPIKII